MAVRRRESSSTQDIQAANDSVSKGSARTPVTRSSTISAGPETLNAITGVHSMSLQTSIRYVNTEGLLKRQRRCKQGKDSNRLADDRCNGGNGTKIEIWELTDQTRQAVDPANWGH